MEKEKERFVKQYGSQAIQPQQMQQGSGDAAIIAALEKLLSM